MRPETPRQRLSPVWRGWVVKLGLAGSAALVAAVVGFQHHQPAPSSPGTPAPPAHETKAGLKATTVSLERLPLEAQRTARLIRTGGPFPYEKDAAVFGNRERLLPAKPRGFYREYTVPEHGSRDRGARRIVCGGWEAREPEQCFYTGDHYASFIAIAW